MNKWKKTFDLQDVWYGRNGECGTEAWTNKTVHELAKEIARRILKHFPEKIEGSGIDFTLVDVYDSFKGVDTELQWQEDVLWNKENSTTSEIEFATQNTPGEQFYTAMKEFYDWADDNDIWINK